MAIFKGAGVAMVTPMKDNGEIDYEVLGQLIEDQIAGHTDAIIICGTTGEAPTLEDDEHLEAIRYTVDKTAGRIPVIAGTGSNNTAHAVMMSKEAQKLGADGCLLVAPYYNKATQNGLVRHFAAIAGAVDIPCILYNVPSRTGSNILPETALRLANEVENIVGIKEASGNIGQVGKLAAIFAVQLLYGAIMPVTGKRETEHLEKLDMNRQRRQPFFAADNKRCAHEMIVDRVREVIRGDSVRF